jgi:hypothetical protein
MDKHKFSNRQQPKKGRRFIDFPAFDSIGMERRRRERNHLFLLFRQLGCFRLLDTRTKENQGKIRFFPLLPQMHHGSGRASLNQTNSVAG